MKVIDLFFNYIVWFVLSFWPWFNRGYDFYVGIGAGVFAFGLTYGAIYSTVSFRNFTIF